MNINFPTVQQSKLQPPSIVFQYENSEMIVDGFDASKTADRQKVDFNAVYEVTEIRQVYGRRLCVLKKFDDDKWSKEFTK